MLSPHVDHQLPAFLATEQWTRRQVGTIDTALEQGLHLARRARTAGVSVELDVWDGLWHTWHYHRDLPEADDALAETVDFIHRSIPRVTPPD